MVSNNGIAINVIGLKSRAYPIQQPPHQASDGESRSQPCGYSDERHYHSLFQQHPHTSAGSRTERDADADFPRALTDRVRNYTV